MFDELFELFDRDERSERSQPSGRRRGIRSFFARLLGADDHPGVRDAPGDERGGAARRDARRRERDDGFEFDD